MSLHLSKLISSLAGKATLTSLLQLANPMLQTVVDWKACLSVSNNSQKIVRIREGMVLRKERELNPGEKLEWHLLGNPAIMHLNIEERDALGIYHPIAGCQKKLDFAHHKIEIKHLDGLKYNPLHCQFGT